MRKIYKGGKREIVSISSAKRRAKVEKTILGSEFCYNRSSAVMATWSRVCRQQIIKSREETAGSRQDTIESSYQTGDRRQQTANSK
jgi:hypothetical protein